MSTKSSSLFDSKLLEEKIKNYRFTVTAEHSRIFKKWFLDQRKEKKN